jgi:TRAP-type C4-dicarboxylate transport system substrate-binding protein
MSSRHWFAAVVTLFAAASATAQTVVLTASAWTPPLTTMAYTQTKWCEAVAAATGNRVRCNVLPKAVAAPPATFDAVRDGLADLSYSAHGYTPGRFVLTTIAELPFAGDSPVATAVAYQRIFERYLAKFDEHRGLKVITVFTHGPGNLLNIRRPVASLADLQGLKFRVGGGMVNEIAKSLGMNATVKPATESYELLSSGVMDGVLFPSESVESFKLEKLIKHRTTFPGGLYNTSFALVMNEKTWNRIGKADQAAIEKLSGEHAARLFGRSWEEADRRGVAFMQANGIVTTKADRQLIDEVKARTSHLERKWIADAKAKGLTNAEEVLRAFKAEVARLQ